MPIPMQRNLFPSARGFIATRRFGIETVIVLSRPSTMHMDDGLERYVYRIVAPICKSFWQVFLPPSLPAPL